MNQILMPEVLPEQVTPDWLNPKVKKQPVFWISEIRLLESLSPNTEDEIRRIELKKGLNIIWSEPGDPDGDDDQRGRGHGAGKTSFCRAIRYLLGERHFGNKFVVDKIGESEALRRAYVVGQVWIGDTPWAVARPLYQGGRHFAISNATIDEAIIAEPAKRQPLDDFLNALGLAVISPWKMRHFDKEKKQAIEWEHVLQPLARDQECHLTSLHNWRDTSSASDSPDMGESERAFLMRCIFGLADDREATQLQNRAHQSSVQNTEENNVTFYNRILLESLAELTTTLPDLPKNISPDDGLFTVTITNAASEQATAKANEVRKKIEVLQITQLRSEREEIVQEIAKIQGRIEEPEGLLQFLKTKLEAHQKKEKPTPQDDEDLRQALLKKLKDTNHCGVPIAIALKDCEVYRRLGITQQPTSPAQDFSNTVVAEYNRKIGELNRQLQPSRDQIQSLDGRKGSYDRAIVTAMAKEEEYRKKLDEILRTPDENIRLARSAITAVTKRTKAYKEIDDAEKSIKKSDKMLDEIRKESADLQQKLSGIFDAVIKEIAGRKKRGELRFTNIQNNASLYRDGETESAAFNALKAIGYDFTALVAWLNDVGFHPGFLLHDSPRESDMEQSLYYPYLRFVASLAKRVPGGFQYIMTTTEPPPESMRNPAFVCLCLDGSTKEGFLYKEIL